MSDFLVKEAPETVIYAYVVPDALNIRKGPSTSDKIIGLLSKDERVEILSNTGQWWKIKSADAEGFVVSDYLRLEENNPAGTGNAKDELDYLKYCFVV
jgi:uncharacterized protein YgiM (DUF1202 family)